MLARLFSKARRAAPAAPIAAKSAKPDMSGPEKPDTTSAPRPASRRDAEPVQAPESLPPAIDTAALVSDVRDAHGAEAGRHAARIVRAVTDIFGAGAPDMAMRLRQATQFGRGVPRDLAPEMGFWMATEIPDRTRTIMLEEAGFCELLLLLKAGAGTDAACEGLEIVADLLPGFDLHDAMSRTDPINLEARAEFDRMIAPVRLAFEKELAA